MDSDKKEGTYSARSAPVTKGEHSDLHVAISSPLGGVLYYYLKTDVQMPHSGCYVNVDGFSETGYTYRSKDWMELNLSIEPGDHVIMWRAWSPAVSLSSTPVASGTIFLDEVSFQPVLIEGFEEGRLLWNSMTFIGFGEWTFDNSNASQGSSSFRSPSLQAGEYSVLSFEVTAPKRGSVLTFWYQASVWMPQDNFIFSINGKPVILRESPSPGWESFGVALTPGTSTLRWEYNKKSDVGTHGGEGAVWLDEISIKPRS